MIKYLGSKRRLIPVLVPMAASAGGKSALDLFSGTARVASAFKAAGMAVTAVDSAAYAHVLASSYVATDKALVDEDELEEAVAYLNALPGRAGYVTEVFCENARYFHPDNGRRIDAVRDAIEERWSDTSLYPLLLTSLLEAADRVDSTTGVQMAYLKSWAPRALRPIELRAPQLSDGGGTALLGDATRLARELGPFDVAYLDPPYNQHQYRGNYHVWETIVLWDAPSHYGVACKRADCKEAAKASPFNKRHQMPAALGAVISATDATLLLVSYNDESWLSSAELVAMCRRRLSSRAVPDGEVAVIAVDQPRYVGARIGIHDPSGKKVGVVSHLRNKELVVAAGPREIVVLALREGLAAAARAELLAGEVAVEPAGLSG